MSRFVIRRKEDGRFLRGGKSPSPLRWVDSIQDARIYGRKCDVSNSIRENFTLAGKYSFQRKQEFSASYEVLPIVLVQLNTGI